MLLKTKKTCTRICVGLFFLLGGIEYGKKLLHAFLAQLCLLFCNFVSFLVLRVFDMFHLLVFESVNNDVHDNSICKHG